MKIKYILFVLILSSFFTRCDLDYYPYDNIEQSQSFQSVGDIGTLVNGSYALLRGVSYGRYTVAPDLQTDLFNATSSYGNNYGIVHAWTELLATTYDIEYPWSGYYNLIANLNNVIQNHTLVTPSEEEVTAYNTYVGEAYFIRAYAYAHLINLYAKAYKSSTASTDLGVPLNLKYDIEEKLPRSTIKEVYDQIFADLGEAESKWKDIDFSKVATYKDSPSRFTKDAITALKARLYLNLEEWNNAITEAEKIITSGSYPLVTTKEALKTLWGSDKGTEIITHLVIDGSKEAPNTNAVYLNGYSSTDATYIPLYIPGKKVYELYHNDDFRKEVYFANHTLKLASGNFKNIYSLNKYPLTKEFSSTGNLLHSPILFRTAELYLIVAEAGARGTQSDLALTRLNDLRKARGLPALTGLSGDALFEEVKDERVRELLAEGTRLTDLKRWGLGFTRSEPQDESAVVKRYVDLTVEPGDDKFVWGIPSYDLNLNPNLVQNQGW
ncbi:RagB/SusD family nutrient uptake outer membrane protein [Limibacterium fermenti]|uniref:RagB/SusD family nutrient uptake outer membrane protein n=1 Tax=Limibacterium fermenti TaxID=3229863 RepID=UPI003A668A0B